MPTLEETATDVLLGMWLTGYAPTVRIWSPNPRLTPMSGAVILKPNKPEVPKPASLQLVGYRPMVTVSIAPATAVTVQPAAAELLLQGLMPTVTVSGTTPPPTNALTLTFATPITSLTLTWTPGSSVTTG